MLGHAFQKAGFVSSTSAAEEEVVLPPEEPTSPEWAIEIGWAITQLCFITEPKLNQNQILARLEPCLDGTNRGRDSWNGFLQKRWDSLTGRQQKESKTEKALDKLTTKGCALWCDYANQILAALKSGEVVAYTAALKKAANIQLPVKGMDEDWDAFKTRVREWAEDFTMSDLKKAMPEGNAYGDFSVGNWVEALRLAQIREEQRAAEVEQEKALKATKAAFTASVEEALEAFKNGATRLPQGLYPFQIDNDPRFFPFGYGETEGRSAAEWAALDDLVLLRHLDQTFRARPEAERRWGPVFWLRDGVVDCGGTTCIFSGEKPEGTRRIACLPNENGWFCTRFLKWRGPEVWDMIQRVRKARRTHGLDVSRVIGGYGRHAEKNFPRFIFTAWKNVLVVGVDNALGAQLDDLKLMQEMGFLEREDCILNAHVRTSASGGLYVAVGSQEDQVLFSVQGGTSSQGRWGLAGSRRSAAEDSSALFAQISGGSRGGGQQRDVIVAAVSEGKHLAEQGGEGYRFGGSTWLQRVPGLGNGNPGVAKDI